MRIFEVGRCFFRDGEDYGQPLRIGALAAGLALPEQWGVPRRPADFFDLKGLIEAGKYRAVIDRRYPLEGAVDATRYVETEQKTGNVVLTVYDSGAR